MDHFNNNLKRNILLFGSEQTGSEKTKECLVQGGYDVYTTDNLNEAIKIAAEKKVAVVLLALGRPGLDPVKIVKHLQRGKDGANIPVIVIVEFFTEDLVASMLKAGAVDYLTHPINPQELLRRTGVYARMEEFDSHEKECEVDSLQMAGPSGDARGLWARLLPGLTNLFQSRFSNSELLDHRYERICGLGIGSFGEVWKVRDITQAPPTVFVAKIPLSKKLNPKIEKEARILKMLADNIAVPEVIEVIETKKKRILIQEFVEGKTLFEVIERELEEKEVESVLIQLLDVVSHAHDLRIIHRDIKPENVMVRPDGTITLLDFGAAKELREKGLSGTVTGSRPYMSPEQIMGQSQRRSDVWALGVVMYVLYTGMYPFYHTVEKVLMDMILELPPCPPSEHNEALDPEIERIILKCLQKDPANRYSDAGTLKNEIMNVFPDFGKRIVPLY